MDTFTNLTTGLAAHYRIRETAGKGGMATVYVADDLKHERPVAIKVLLPELVARNESLRFLQEIRIAARLSHPNILPLLDSGTVELESGASLLYYVMPYAGCESLRDRLVRQGRLPVDEALRITRTVGAALDYAHRQGVLHRDIKPENILLQEGEAVVADFGIARALTAAAVEHVTERGIALGTIAYISPEQATGDPSIDGRSDLYSLACVLYEMLAGEPPFHSGSAQSVLMQHLTAAPRPLRDHRPTLPVAVEQAVARALGKEPGNRFATMHEFSAALEGPAATEPSRRDRPTKTIAVMPFVNATPDPENEYLSDGVTDELINALAKVDGLEVTSRTSVFAHKGRKEDIRTIGRELAVSTILEGSVRRSGDRLRITVQLTNVADGRLLWAERYDRAAGDVFDLEEEMADTIVSTLRANLLGEFSDPTPKRYTDNVRAYHLYLKGRFAWNKRTPEGVLEAIRWFEEAIAADPDYALAYTGLADSYALQVDYRGAPVIENLRRARAEAEHALALDDELAEAHTSLGWVSFIHDWDWDKARRHFDRAVGLNPRYPTARQWRSWYLVAMGRIDEAIAEGRLGQTLDPASVSIRRSLGWLLYYARRFDEAIAQLRQALMMNPTSEETQWILGLAYTEAGKYAEAEAILTEAHAGSRGQFHAFASLGRLAALRGRRAETEQALQTLHETAGRRYVSPVDFARIYLALGDTDRTFEWIERAHEERRGWMVYLRVEPTLGPIRGDPRFTALLRRMRLD
ncbi:MAG: protein kinase [Gemmatimonadota bacterium]